MHDKLERILVNHDRLVEMSASDRKLRSIHLVDKDLLQEIVKFLEMFVRAFDVFEIANEPTIHRVLVIFYQLLDHCNNQTGNLAVLASNIKMGLEEKFFPIISKHHYMATMLCPKYRKFSFIYDPVTRAAKIAETKSWIRENTPDKDQKVVAIKKPKLDQGKDKGFGEDSSDEETILYNVEQDDLDFYLSAKIPKSDSVLDYWKESKSNLLPLIKIIFSIPASSSLLERSF